MKTMKITKYLINILFTAVFVLGLSFSAMAAQIHGNVDDIHEASISGWAWNAETPDIPVSVTVTILDDAGNFLREESVTADIQRDDVAASGYGSGICGFNIPMDWSEFPDGTYTIHVSADGQPIGSDRHYYKGQAPVRSLGVFKTTGYCPCYSCSEGWGRSTSTGAVASANHTIAVDPRIIPYGTKVMINGIVYTAEDKGGGVKGNHIDIFYNTHGETRIQGVQYAEVFVVEA
ncbi:MAG: 3D domain-containing protein [Lachnospiraceae bacterium]|nr:3D domain-containing protein [Lachnospiraceae bacterium]